MSLSSQLLYRSRQAAVYWPPLPADQYGVPTWGAPVQIKCRWEDTIEEFIDAKGSKAFTRAKVFADRVLTPGGVLFKGTLAAISSSAAPKDNPGAWEIRSFNNTPNLNQTDVTNVALL